MLNNKVFNEPNKKLNNMVVFKFIYLQFWFRILKGNSI